MSRVRGETVWIAAGAAAGLAVEMTGRFCGEEEVGGQRVEVCPARFVLVTVAADEASARVTAGDASAVSAGMKAQLDQPVAAPAAAADAALQAADSLFDDEQYELAASAYRDFLARFPDHRSAAYAQGLAMASEAKVAEARAAATPPPPPPAPDAGERASRLADQAARLLAAGLAGEAATTAREALALAPDHAAAAATLRAAEAQLAEPADAVQPGPGGTRPPGPAAAPVPAGPRGRWEVESCTLTTRLKGGGAVSSLRLAAGALDLIEDRFLAAGSEVADLRRLRILFPALGEARPGRVARGAEARFIASIAPDLRFTPAWMDTAPRDLECTLVRTPPAR